MSTELTKVATICREDSDGESWRIQGKLIWLILAGAITTILLLTGTFVALEMNLLLSVIVSAPPLLLAIGYTVLKQTKPPGYDMDLLRIGYRIPNLYGGLCSAKNRNEIRYVQLYDICRNHLSIHYFHRFVSQLRIEKVV